MKFCLKSVGVKKIVFKLSPNNKKTILGAETGTKHTML